MSGEGREARHFEPISPPEHPSNDMDDIKKTGLKGVEIWNWSKTFSCKPEILFAPKTVDDLKEILKVAREENKKVKVIGRGHSPSDIAFTDDYLISLQNLNKVVSVSSDDCQITVEAGMTLKELNEIHLPKCEMALPVLGSVSDITVGGAISTGTHGTGNRYGILSSYVIDLELLTADGKTINCSEKENKDLFNAAVCSLGALGIILNVTLQCRKPFHLSHKQYGLKLQDVIEHLDVHFCASDRFRFMWFPYTDSVVVSHVSVTEVPVTKYSWWGSLCQWTMDYALGYYLLEFCYYVSTYFPRIVPYINRFFYNAVFSRHQEIVDVSHKVLNFECLFKQHVTEWAISREKVGSTLWQLREWIESNLDAAVHFPIEVRFAKSDKIMISPAYGRDTCFINIIMYRPYGITVPYQKYWSAYERIMEEAGGRPHWAKAHSITAEKFSVMYPEFQKWCSIRNKLDPTNMFINLYMERILHHAV